MKKSKAKNNISKLKKLKLAYLRERKGYRETQYQILAGAMSIAVDLRSNRESRERFLRLSGAKSPKAGSKGKSGWITRAVVGFVTSAKSENQIKLSSKRARVLEFLYDTHNVLPKDIPAEIRKQGGIEAIARLAAKVNPRRATDGDDAKGRKSKSSARAESDVGKESEHDQQNNGDELNDDSNSKRAAGPADGGDDRLTIHIRRRLRKKLFAGPLETPVKLIGILTNNGHSNEKTIFKVRKVLRPSLKS